METCVFCKIIAGSIPSTKVFEDNDTIAFMDIHPMHKGHLLIAPKKHVDYLFDVPDPIYSKLFLNAKKVSNALKKVTNSVKIAVAVEGIAIRHAHIHLVPVNNINDLDPCKSINTTPKEIKQIADKIIKEMKQWEWKTKKKDIKNT